jgi:hypothetical protein
VVIDQGRPARRPSGRANVACLQAEEATLPELLNSLSQMDHPRLAEVLRVIGEHRPTEPRERAARKALMKHRNRE